MTLPPALLDQAPCGFLSFLDDGGIVLVNQTLLDMLGHAREDLVGRHVESILTVGARVFYQTHLFPLARLHGHAEEIFLMLRTRAGEDLGVFANVRRRVDEGESVAYDMVLMRVGERQKYEEELLHARRVAEETAAELEATSEELIAANDELLEQTETANRMREQADSANRAKSDFLAVMSHELRTPLNAISGYVQLLDMGVKGPVNEAQREVLDRIDRSQLHLLRLINDLLNLSKLEAGAVDYAIEDVLVSGLVADVTPLVEPMLAEKRIAFDVDVPIDLAVRADADKAMQILINLLSNAAKFTPDGGRVALRAGVLEGGGARPFLSVADSGTGIPEDKLEAVFEPFVQVGSGATRSKGTGLGLAISRDLARGMGGDIELRSIVGEGSTFTLLLPPAAAAATGAAGEKA